MAATAAARTTGRRLEARPPAGDPRARRRRRRSAASRSSPTDSIARGFAVTQATVSRDIARARPRQGPARRPATSTSSGPRGPSPARPRGPPSDERLRRILADIPVTIGRSGLILLVTGSPGTASVIAQAIDESSLTEQEGTLAGRQHAPRPVRRRGPPRALARAVRGLRSGATGPWRPAVMKKVVLAYSGGLDTSVAVAWLREQYDVRGRDA